MSPASASSAGALRWLLKFSFFLVLFAALVLALAYGWEMLRGKSAPLTPPPQATPTPVASPTLPLAGSTGHAEPPPSPRP
jgi:hypothetical protein